jgi:hypothetical protein
MMYLDFYGLRKAPFQSTLDPDFLFLSPSHKVVLGAIIYGIEDRQGFVAITIFVSPGEDISSIAEEIYGFANDELFQLIQQSNPQIKDLQKIKIGDRIILPAFPATFDKFLGAG